MVAPGENDLTELSSGNRQPRRSGGLLQERLKGLEPSTFCMASRRSSQLSYSREVAEYNPATAAAEAPAPSRPRGA